MVSIETLNFLKELKENNYKEWFHAQKNRYAAVKTEMEQITNQLIAGIATFDEGVTGLNPKNCLFRINRDIRFSADKSPYKTNLGSFVVEGGKKSGLGGYYLHIEPGGSFLGGGIHMPPSAALKAIRTEIYNFTDEFIEIVENESFKNAFGGISGDKLKSAPQGFDKSFDYIDLLKYKSYTVFDTISDDEITNPSYLQKVLEHFKTMQPFIAFLNRGIREN